MEPDFVTRQHLESLGNGDPGLSDVLNRYKNFGQTPTPLSFQQTNNQSQLRAPNGDAILLSHMLGQIQASMQKGDNRSNLDGIQLNINSDVFKWILLLLFVLILVYLFLKSNKESSKSIDKKIDKLHDQIRTLKSYRSKRRNPSELTNLELDDPSVDLPDDLSDDDLPDNLDDLDDLDYDLSDDL